jgi:cbb3-type cytochrome c oxidase subunit II
MKMTPAVILVGVLGLLAAITLTMVYWPYARQDLTPSEIFRVRTSEEDAGRKIYLQNGCVYCHSQSVRTFDWDVGSERIAQAGDYVADEPIQLGSQRTGVDLSHDGGEHPDDWQIAHFINPRYTRPDSVMPPFEWLGMERLKTLTVYVQSLGLKMADRRMERQRYWKQESIKAYEAGPDANVRWLVEHVPAGWHMVPDPTRPPRRACTRAQDLPVFLHRLPRPGRRRHGAGQLDLPPPLNFTILKGRQISGRILYYQIMNGITGTAMPYFKRDLESQKIWEVELRRLCFINQSDANQNRGASTQPGSRKAS